MKGSGMPMVGTNPKDMPMLMKKCKNNMAAKAWP